MSKIIEIDFDKMNKTISNWKSKGIKFDNNDPVKFYKEIWLPKKYCDGIMFKNKKICGSKADKLGFNNSICPLSVKALDHDHAPPYKTRRVCCEWCNIYIDRNSDRWGHRIEKRRNLEHNEFSQADIFIRILFYDWFWMSTISLNKKTPVFPFNHFNKKSVVCGPIIDTSKNLANYWSNIQIEYNYNKTLSLEDLKNKLWIFNGEVYIYICDEKYLPHYISFRKASEYLGNIIKDWLKKRNNPKWLFNKDWYEDYDIDNINEERDGSSIFPKFPEEIKYYTKRFGGKGIGTNPLRRVVIDYMKKRDEYTELNIAVAAINMKYRDPYVENPDDIYTDFDLEEYIKNLKNEDLHMKIEPKVIFNDNSQKEMDVDSDDSSFDGDIVYSDSDDY